MLDWYITWRYGSKKARKLCGRMFLCLELVASSKIFVDGVDHAATKKKESSANIRYGKSMVPYSDAIMIRSNGLTFELLRNSSQPGSSIWRIAAVKENSTAKGRKGCPLLEALRNRV